MVNILFVGSREHRLRVPQQSPAPTTLSTAPSNANSSVVIVAAGLRFGEWMGDWMPGLSCGSCRDYDVSLIAFNSKSHANGNHTLRSEKLSLTVDGRKLEFQRVSLTFLGHGMTDVFGQKNSRTVVETLAHKRYAKLNGVIVGQSPSYLDEPLGDFLLKLKQSGNSIYKRFLNPYGDGVYCRFRMESGPLSSKKGLYCYCVGDRLVYVGRSFDPFKKRINQGYGTIHPKNCFIDGQATNCHLNALIAENVSAVSLFVIPLSDDLDIERLEPRLIQMLQPSWNIALK
jgi:hypothetical protein